MHDFNALRDSQTREWLLEEREREENGRAFWLMWVDAVAVEEEERCQNERRKSRVLDWREGRGEGGWQTGATLLQEVGPIAKRVTHQIVFVHSTLQTCVS